MKRLHVMKFHEKKSSNIEGRFEKEQIQNFFRSKKTYTTLFVFGQFWVAVISILSNQLVRINFDLPFCGAILPLVRAIYVIFFITQGFNFVYIFYLRFKNEINTLTATLTPTSNFIISGLIFSFSFIIPMC
ncbi:MAG: hypothetical protein HGN29_13030 [Asgard group archaeon]|nr:hypothetical protein [Asgard group archaeon]